MVDRESVTQPIDESLAHLLERRAVTHPDRLAFRMTSRAGATEVLTYAELDRQARELAAGLLAMGAPGDRVALLLPNGLEFLVGFFACADARMTAVPLPYPVVGSPSQKLLTQLTPMFKGTAAAVTITTAKVRDLLEPEAAFGRCGTVSDLRTTGSPIDTHGLPGRDDLALLQFTSGSTTQPRGVMLSHGNVLHNLAQLAQFGRMDHREVAPQDTHLVSWLPLFHDMGLAMATFAIQVGGSCDLMTPSAFLMRPRSWLEMISRVGAHFSGAPNFAYDLCTDNISPSELAGLDLSTWELALNAAEPVRAETVRRFCNYFGPVGFSSSAMAPCYGLAEATVFASGVKDDVDSTVLRLDRQDLLNSIVTLTTDGNAAEVVSCARPPQRLTIAIVDVDTGVRAPAGRVGEIWIHGPNVSRGYWKRPDVASTTFGGAIPGDERAYLRTGDLGFIHDGELYVTGRLKDIIIVDGRNHQPQDIEHTVRHCHPDLEARRCAAFTLDPGTDSRLVIAAELSPEAWRTTVSNSRPDLREEIERSIRTAVNDDHQLVVQAVALLAPGSVPFTTSGKVQRPRCRQRYLDGRWS